MYKCELCQQIMPPGTKSFRLPVEFRPRTYPKRENANHFKRENRRVVRDDRGGVGREIVRELTVCPSCLANHQQHE